MKQQQKQDQSPPRVTTQKVSAESVWCPLLCAGPGWVCGLHPGANPKSAGMVEQGRPSKVERDAQHSPSRIRHLQCRPQPAHYCRPALGWPARGQSSVTTASLSSPDTMPPRSKPQYPDRGHIVYMPFPKCREKPGPHPVPSTMRAGISQVPPRASSQAGHGQSKGLRVSSPPPAPPSWQQGDILQGLSFGRKSCPPLVRVAGRPSASPLCRKDSFPSRMPQGFRI